MMRFYIVFDIALCLGFAWCEPEVVIKRMDSGVSPGFCTNVSFSYPGWEVTDLLLTNVRIDFQIINNANPSVKTFCSGDVTDSSRNLHECNDHQTLFAYDIRSALLAINQTWTCDETNIKFVGIGNVTLDCSSNAGNCSALNTEPILGTLIAPVQITPTPISAPRGTNRTGCTRNSRIPAWEVSNLFYQRVDFGPPCNPVSGQCPSTRLYYGDIEFDLVNAATGDKRHCGAQYLGLSDLQSGYGDWLSCGAGLVFINLLPPPGRDHETTTFFRFNHSTNTLELNQTWYCDDLGFRDEYSFTAYGAVGPALDPGVAYIGNLTVPQVRVNTSSPVLVVPATVVEEHKLAPNTLHRPQAFGRSCTVTSVLEPPKSFQIYDFWFSTYWKDANLRTSYVYMYVTNWMFNIELNFNAEGAAMTPGITGLSDPSIWYGCNGGDFSASPGGRLLNCSFAFDRVANRLSVREDWVCADKDHEHP